MVPNVGAGHTPAACRSAIPPGEGSAGELGSQGGVEAWSQDKKMRTGCRVTEQGEVAAGIPWPTPFSFQGNDDTLGLKSFSRS